MEKVLQSITTTVAYLTVFIRLHDKWLRKKGVFRQKTCIHLSHISDEEGTHPTHCKDVGIQNAPVPQNMRESRRFIGLIHYYRNFIKNIGNLLVPLNELTRLGPIVSGVQ